LMVFIITTTPHIAPRSVFWSFLSIRAFSMFRGSFTSFDTNLPTKASARLRFATFQKGKPEFSSGPALASAQDAITVNLLDDSKSSIYFHGCHYSTT
jgi:hypothetical protein